MDPIIHNMYHYVENSDELKTHFRTWIPTN